MSTVRYFEQGNKKLTHDFGFRHPIYNDAYSHHNNDGEMNKMSDKKADDGFKKVEDKIFKFEKEGDMIEGELLSIEDGKTYDNKVYKIKQTSDGETMTVFSTTVLESQMASVKIGNLVRIILANIKKSEVKGRNDTKMFEVYVKTVK